MHRLIIASVLQLTFQLCLCGPIGNASSISQYPSTENNQTLSDPPEPYTCSAPLHNVEFHYYSEAEVTYDSAFAFVVHDLFPTALAMQGSRNRWTASADEISFKMDSLTGLGLNVRAMVDTVSCLQSWIELKFPPSRRHREMIKATTFLVREKGCSRRVMAFGFFRKKETGGEWSLGLR